MADTHHKKPVVNLMDVTFDRTKVTSLTELYMETHRSPVMDCQFGRAIRVAEQVLMTVTDHKSIVNLVDDTFDRTEVTSLTRLYMKTRQSPVIKCEFGPGFCVAKHVFMTGTGHKPVVDLVDVAFDRTEVTSAVHGNTSITGDGMPLNLLFVLLNTFL